jgi:Formyl transferase
MNEETSLNVAIVTINDTIYAPLYISHIHSGLAEVPGVRIKTVFTQDATAGLGVWRQVKRRLSLYGFGQFLLFILLLVRTKIQALLEPLINFKRPYSLKRLCRQEEIQFEPVLDVNSESFIKSLQDQNIGVLVSIATAQRYKKRTRDTVAYPLNIHSSLLPKYAGIMGLFWAVVRGETEAGVTLFVMEKNFDEGDILGQVAFDIKGLDSLHQLYHLSVLKGSSLVVKTLKEISSNQVKRVPQDPASGSYFSSPQKKDRKRFFKRGFKFFRVKDLIA